MTELPAVRPAQQPQLQVGEYEFMVRIVQNVASTDFVPKGLRGNPHACLACVLYGRALGLDPMIALREISMIDGQPSLSAVLIMGRVIEAGHTVYVTESTNEKCTMYGKRGDNGAELTLTWTIEEAARILTYVRGEQVPLTRKDNWRNYPRAMLRSRVATEMGRSLFPDVFSGMTLYTPEELGASATDEEGRPIVEGEVVSTDPPGATEILVSDHDPQAGPTVVTVEAEQPQPEPPPVPAEPVPATPSAEPVAAEEEPLSPGAAPQAEGQVTTAPAPQPTPIAEEVQAQVQAIPEPAVPPATAPLVDDRSPAERGMDDQAVAAATADDDVVEEDPHPDVSVAELAARAQAAQLSAPEDLRPQPEGNALPGQVGLEGQPPAPAPAAHEVELTFEQQFARDLDITDLHTWNMQDLRKAAARVGVKSRDLKKHDLLAELREAVTRLRASIPALGGGGADAGPPASVAVEEVAPQVAAHVSPSPEPGPVAEPAAPPGEPDPIDFEPLTPDDFVQPTVHTILPPLPEGSSIQQPFRSLSDEAKAVLLDAAIAFSAAHFPDRREWSKDLVLMNAQRAWKGVGTLEDLQGWQIESIWRAVPEDVKNGLAVHYTSGQEGSLL